MDARTVLRRAWNDSVWSKVIAAAITAVLAAGLSTLASSWDALEAPRHQLLHFVATPVTLPAWSLAALALVMAVLVGLSCRKRHNTTGADDIQPNAVPIVEARLFACPLESPTPTPSRVP